MSFNVLSKSIDYEEVISNSQLSPVQRAAKQARDEELKRVIEGEDQRFLAVVGPCSAHDEEAVVTYALKLARVQERLKDKIFIVPRVYTNKPRTTGDGYKGMLHQPDPDGKPNLIKGLAAIRHLHKRVIAETGLTTADEMLYPENYIFLQDLISYIAVGARSVEDQQHRFVASGIDHPVGLKNPTSGNLNVMFNSLQAVQTQHEFIYDRQEVLTSANPLAHVVLRGAVDQHRRYIPNYHYEDLVHVVELYKQRDARNPFVVVDTNHDNSGKQYREQVRIVKDVLFSRSWNEDVRRYVRGFMIESFLVDGKQEEDGKVFGQSITDPCLGWESTEKLLDYIAEKA